MSYGVFNKDTGECLFKYEGKWGHSHCEDWAVNKGLAEREITPIPVFGSISSITLKENISISLIDD